MQGVAHVRPVAALIMLTAGACACVKMVPSPFHDEDASDAVDAGDENAGDGDAAGYTGKPCTQDTDCDDGIECTVDTCDPLERVCSLTADDGKCANGRYCDGVEVCDSKQGCVAGTPITCSDNDECTVDKCVEDSESCTHEPRDADNDGDPDYHCKGGGDCNDQDPYVSSTQPEVCSNLKDDDCDGTVDEADCASPGHDTCSDPADLVVGTLLTMTTLGAKLDYSASCVVTTTGTVRDVVAAVEIPDGDPVNLDVVARINQYGLLYLATGTQCGDPAQELACSTASSSTSGGMVSRLIVRELSPGVYPLMVFSDSMQEILIQSELRAASPKPTNETCGTALPIQPGEDVVAEVLDVARDVVTACTASAGDLLYSFELTEPHDVTVFGASLDGVGDPVIGLRSAGCVDATDEIGCKSAAAAEVYARALPAGTYYVQVSATAPTFVQFSVELEPPSQAPGDETCSTAPAIEPGKSIGVSLAQHMDDVHTTCMPSAVDAVYSLAVNATSDVLLVGRMSQGDYGAVSLYGESCEATEELVCMEASPSPVRAAVHGLAPGTYKAVIETHAGNPVELTAFVRPVVTPVYVLFADVCAEARSSRRRAGTTRGTRRR